MSEFDKKINDQEIYTKQLMSRESELKRSLQQIQKEIDQLTVIHKEKSTELEKTTDKIVNSAKQEFALKRQRDAHIMEEEHKRAHALKESKKKTPTLKQKVKTRAVPKKRRKMVVIQTKAGKTKDDNADEPVVLPPKRKAMSAKKTSSPIVAKKKKRRVVPQASSKPSTASASVAPVPWILRAFKVLAKRLNACYVVDGKCTLLDRVDSEITELSEMWPHVVKLNGLIEQANQSAKRLQMSIGTLKPIQVPPPTFWSESLNADDGLLRRLFVDASMFQGMTTLSENWSKEAFETNPHSWAGFIVPILSAIREYAGDNTVTRTGLTQSLVSAFQHNPLVWVVTMGDPTDFAVKFITKSSDYRTPSVVLSEVLEQKTKALKMYLGHLKLAPKRE